MSVSTLPLSSRTRLAAACEGKGPDGWLFSGGDAPLPYPHPTSGWFAHAVRAAPILDDRIPRITPHDLRHTAASLAVSSGANVKVAQRMLGPVAVATAMSEARKAAAS
ncbi:tyrosine-type recombinase/integrase [Microbacterium sp. NPDC056052]|uniref:tyrosine-type recombinase/integrase n=1 Tax=Microbacterium sp. NPDC056052 TaxID=3345695 RepID=UPI0035D8EA37